MRRRGDENKGVTVPSAVLMNIIVFRLPLLLDVELDKGC
jgi:hypothetical protein